jgi:hypothetical protein
MRFVRRVLHYIQKEAFFDACMSQLSDGGL